VCADAWGPAADDLHLKNALKSGQLAGAAKSVLQFGSLGRGVALIVTHGPSRYSFWGVKKKFLSVLKIMKSQVSSSFFAGFAAPALVLLGSGCGAEQPAAEQRRPTVVATTTIVADLVREVAADRVDVVSLMGPGIDPHSYRPTPRDADRLARADLILASGLHLEGKLAELLERMSRRTPVVFVAEAVDESLRLEAAAGIADPHVWFDLSLWTACIDPAVEALAELVPEAATTFEVAGVRYREQLMAAHEDIAMTISSIPPEQRVLVTAHDAFRYFGRAYGIEVVGVQGVSTESEAGLADINRLVDLLVERNVPAVFVETSVPDRSVKAIIEGAAARGHEVTTGGRLYSDALGEPGSGGESLEAAIRANVTVIADALGTTPSPSPGEAAEGVPAQATEPAAPTGGAADTP
jgi:manganese/zinc/iron transport system substrate-binding protein